MSNIVLASSSPRRKQLLQMCGLDFDVIASKCDESIKSKLSAREVVTELSQAKAVDIFEKVEKNKIIIAADTVVSLNDNIFTKPNSEQDSYNMLTSLSGKTHQVYTGVCLAKNKKIIKSFYCKTDVSFYKLSDEEILAYIATGEPCDKAGSYAIQGIGAALVKEIYGDYYNVVGLPIARVIRELREMY